MATNAMLVLATWLAGVGSAPASQPAAAGAWPCWSGPTGTFAGSTGGAALVSDLSEARQVWRSEAITPLGKAYAANSKSVDGGRHGSGQRGLPSGGGSSPVVADGRVFLTYFVPAGEAVAEDLPPRMPEEPRSGRLIEADVVFLAVDAATGRTAWTRVFPREGANIQDMKSCSYSGLSPCVADGRVYGLSTSLVLHALHADSGEPLWATPVPGAHEELQAAKQRALAERRLVNPVVLDKRVGGSLVCVGGVVVVPLKGTWIGFDAASGAVLWTARDVGGRAATPAWWERPGGAWLIAANSDGELRAIEPRTGRTVWTQSGAGPNGGTVLVAGDIPVAKSRAVELPGKRDPDEVRIGARGELAAYRLSDTGATLLWRLPGERYWWNEQTPAIADGCVYAQLQTPQRAARLVCMDLASGRVLGEAPAPSGFGGDACTAVVGDRVLASADASHMRTRFAWYRAGPGPLEVLTELWTPPHAPTTSYHPAMSFPVVDGRLYVRGADGLYCYDLRATPASQAAPR